MEKLSYNKDLDFIVIDVETENLNLSCQYNRPWEVAMMVCRGKSIISEYSDCILWPDLNLSAGAARKTKFNKDHYYSVAKPPEEVWNNLKPYFENDNYYIVTQNGLGFDTYLIKSWLELIGQWHGYTWIERSIDINLLSRAYHYSVKPDTSKFLAWQYKMMTDRRRGVKTNLRAMCKEFGIEFDDSKYHEALYDVQKTREVFLQLIYKLDL